jgi:hypothetical protein
MTTHRQLHNDVLEGFIDPFDIRDLVLVDQPFTTSDAARGDQPWRDVVDLARGSRDQPAPPTAPGAVPSKTREADRISPLRLRGRRYDGGQVIPRGGLRDARRQEVRP